MADNQGARSFHSPTVTTNGLTLLREVFRLIFGNTGPEP